MWLNWAVKGKKWKRNTIIGKFIGHNSVIQSFIFVVIPCFVSYMRLLEFFKIGLLKISCNRYGLLWEVETNIEEQILS